MAAIEAYELRQIALDAGKAIDPRLADKLYTLLQGFGDHYDLHFGVDMRRRLSGMSPSEGTLCCIAVEKNTGAVVSHVSIAFDRTRPKVGLLGGVFTHPSHRHRGLSRALVEKVIGVFDTSCGDVLVLGTRSSSSAEFYRSYGFHDVGGAIDLSLSGYNPDVGTLIMTRECYVQSCPKDRQSIGDRLYPKDLAIEDFVVEPLECRHWASLVLLLGAYEGANKLPAARINTGLDGQEAILNLIRNSSNAYCAVLKDGMVHGLTYGGDTYYAPNSPCIEQVLDKVRTKTHEDSKIVDIPPVDDLVLWKPQLGRSMDDYVLEVLIDATYAKEVASCHTRSWQLAYAELMSKEYLHNELPAEFEQSWSEKLSVPISNRHRVFVIVARPASSGPVCGFACMAPACERYFGLLLDNLHVLPEHRRKGIASLLIRSCREWTRTFYPGEAIHLTCFADNHTARATYKKANGFETDPHDYTSSDGAVNPCVRYLWTKP